MTGPIKRIRKKIDEIQDEACIYCPLGWEERGPEDCDCGCLINKDNSFCYYAYLPMWIRRIIRNRHDKRENDYWEREIARYEQMEMMFGGDDED